METPKVEDKAVAVSTSSSSVLGANDVPKPSSAGLLGDLVISINKGKFMTLQPEQLVVQVEHTSAGSSFCGIPIAGTAYPVTTIPLYNVLWAERRDTLLEVVYAESAGKHKLKPTTISVEVSATDASVDTFVDALMGRAYGEARRQKRAKVLVNPHAGPGGSESKYRNDAEPLFRAARMELDVHITSRSREAIDISRDIDIDAFDTIIACSGDGLPYEVFNGLGARPDARRALNKIAVNQIPCGSGNALACCYYGSHHVSEAALAIIKGVDTPVDLVALTYGDQRILSFLSQVAGLLADADLGTEHMRWMGALRFEVGVVQRLIKKKAYPCDIAIKVVSDDKEVIKGMYKKHKQGPRVAEVPSVDEDTSAGLPPLKYGTINDPVPGDWEQIKYDKMGTFFCGTMPYMAPDVTFFPAAVPDDGMMDLVTMDSDVSFFTGVNMVATQMGDGGEFFGSPIVKYRKITAFRLTPRDQKHGFISIDGEGIPFVPFQCEIVPKLGMVHSPKKGFFSCKGPKGWEDSQVPSQ